MTNFSLRTSQLLYKNPKLFAIYSVMKRGIEKVEGSSDGEHFASPSHSGVPLTPGPAREIITELFKEKPQWTTAALIDQVPRKHCQQGGFDGKDSIKNVVNKALGYLKEDGCVRRKSYGNWERIAEDLDAAADVLDLPAAPPSAVILPQDKIKIERTLGEGPESLYVYYYNTDRELADLKGQSTWPCKIGNAGHAVERVLNQARTARHSLPVIALVIRSDDAEELERLIHRLFKRARLWIDNDYCGDEWFITNPEQVASCYSAIEDLVRSLRLSGQDRVI
jgi:hypothetical protein